MIESLSLKNFYCFNDTETISFVASKERNRIQDQQYSGFATMNRVNILKLAYLIGHNDVQLRVGIVNIFDFLLPTFVLVYLIQK